MLVILLDVEWTFWVNLLYMNKIEKQILPFLFNWAYLDRSSLTIAVLTRTGNWIRKSEPELELEPENHSAGTLMIQGRGIWSFTALGQQMEMNSKRENTILIKKIENDFTQWLSIVPLNTVLIEPNSSCDNILRIINILCWCLLQLKWGT